MYHCLYSHVQSEYIHTQTVHEPTSENNIILSGKREII